MRRLGIYLYSKAKTIIIIAAGLIKRIHDQRVLKLLERPKKTKILFPITSPKMRRKKDKIMVKAKAMVAIMDNRRTFQRERVSCLSYALFKLFITAFIPFEAAQSAATILKDKKVCLLAWEVWSITFFIISYAILGMTFDKSFKACSLVIGVKLIRLMRNIKKGKRARIK